MGNVIDLKLAFPEPPRNYQYLSIEPGKEGIVSQMMHRNEGFKLERILRGTSKAARRMIVPGVDGPAHSKAELELKMDVPHPEWLLANALQVYDGVARVLEEPTAVSLMGNIKAISGNIAPAQGQTYENLYEFLLDRVRGLQYLLTTREQLVAIAGNAGFAGAEFLPPVEEVEKVVATNRQTVNNRAVRLVGNAVHDANLQGADLVDVLTQVLAAQLKNPKEIISAVTDALAPGQAFNTLGDASHAVGEKRTKVVRD